MKKTIIFIFILFFMVFYMSGEKDNLLTVEDIYLKGKFNTQYLRPNQWLIKMGGYTILERADNKKFNNLVLVNLKTGKKKILVKGEKFLPEGKTTPLRIQSYTWSKNFKKLLLFTNTKRVWRRNTRGDYWIMDLEKGSLKQLGKTLPPSTLMFAKLSPVQNQVAFVSQNNIYIQDLTTFKITQVTSDGSKNIVNGTFDWVYEEEFGIRDGFRWSPDGKHIAFWQMDTTGVGVFNMINYTESIYSKVIPVQYPKVGTTNSACKIGVLNVKNKMIKWMDTPGDPRNNYLARMDWAASNSEISIQQFNRQQNDLKFWLFNIKSGKGKIIVNEKSKTWIDVVDNVQWSKSGSHFTWLSERNGWMNLYLISRDGASSRNLTPGNFDVTSIKRIDLNSGWVYYIASPNNPTQRYLYRSKIKGKNRSQLLSKSTRGTNNYRISPDNRWAFHTYSDYDTPPVIELIRLPSHKKVRNLINNKSVSEKLKKLALGKTEFIKVPLKDGTLLDAYITKPKNLDPNKKYPLFFYVYGEPAAQTVLDRWGGNTSLWHHMLTQKGYVIASIDNRGTPAPRGVPFRKAMYKKIGILPPKDQAYACQKILDKYTCLDKNRIGVWGWSGGGSNTLNLLFHYPKIYKMGISIAAVSNQKIYDTIYQERYMGHPKDNPEAYRLGSPITHAGNLEGKLLLIHGTGDDNCHFQGAHLLITELVKKNKQFDLFTYPNANHGMRDGKNNRQITYHLFTMMTRYVKNNL